MVRRVDIRGWTVCRSVRLGLAFSLVCSWSVASSSSAVPGAGLHSSTMALISTDKQVVAITDTLTRVSDTHLWPF